VFTPLPSGCGIETRQTAGLGLGVRTGGKKEKKKGGRKPPTVSKSQVPQTLSDMTPHVRTAHRD